MCDHESQRIICELSAAMDQLMLNQNEMAARAKQTNEILKSMQKVTEELKEENTRLYHENALLRGDAGFQKEHHPLQGMLRLAPVDDDDEATTEDTEEDDDSEVEEEVFENLLVGLVKQISLISLHIWIQVVVCILWQVMMKTPQMNEKLRVSPQLWMKWSLTIKFLYKIYNE